MKKGKKYTHNTKFLPKRREYCNLRTSRTSSYFRIIQNDIAHQFNLIISATSIHVKFCIFVDTKTNHLDLTCVRNFFEEL